MKCHICKNGQTRRGTTALTLERGPLTLTVRHVSAQNCNNRGKDYIDEATAQVALTQAETAALQSVTGEVGRFAVT